jgi:ankyrin repeat protein
MCRYYVSVDAEGRRPIHCAIISGAIADITFLLDQGIESAHLLEGDPRLSLLDFALKHQRLAIVDVLLPMNADWV